MPHALAALENGTLTEWRAELVTREVAVLSPEQRSLVDAELSETLGDGLGLLGDRELSRRVRAIAYRVDAASVLNRCRGAETERRVSVRPAPDAMAYLTAYLPVAQAVAAHAALTRAAATRAGRGRRADQGAGHGRHPGDAGDRAGRGRGGARRDPARHDRPHAPGRGLHARARAGLRAGAGWVGSGPRRWSTRGRPLRGAACGCDGSTPTPRPARSSGWTRPGGCSRADYDGSSSRGTASAGPRGATRPSGTSTTCRPTPPSGATSADNGQGYCVRCNHTKQHPGWRTEVVTEDVFPDDTHTVVTTTPTGHRYRSTAPPVIAGQRPPGPDESPLERHYELRPRRLTSGSANPRTQSTTSSGTRSSSPPTERSGKSNTREHQLKGIPRWSLDGAHQLVVDEEVDPVARPVTGVRRGTRPGRAAAASP